MTLAASAYPAVYGAPPQSSQGDMQTMADPPRDPDAQDMTQVESGQESAPRTPGWVIVLGVIALILILAVVAQFVLGIQHGPSMHEIP
jgi:hypothetical protein